MNGITDHDETELRDLFEDAVSDVHPRGELTRIMSRARRETAPSPTRWLPLTAAAHQLYLAAAGAGLGGEDDSAVVKVYQQLSGIKLPEKKKP